MKIPITRFYQQKGLFLVCLRICALYKAQIPKYRKFIGQLYLEMLWGCITPLKNTHHWLCIFPYRFSEKIYYGDNFLTHLNSTLFLNPSTWEVPRSLPPPLFFLSYFASVILLQVMVIAYHYYNLTTSRIKEKNVKLNLNHMSTSFLYWSCRSQTLHIRMM